MSKKHSLLNRNVPPQTPKPRRLRAPQLSLQAKFRLQHGFVYRPAEYPNPYVDKIISLVDEMAVATGLSPQIILTDWIGMIDGALIRWAENIKSVAIEGKIIKDTPEYFEIYKRARERFIYSSSRHNPAAYAKMQESFITAFNLLKEAALPLEDYAQQREFHPDVVGQVFVHFFPTPEWQQYFCHDWGTCLDYAMAMMPPPEKTSEDVFLGIKEAQAMARSKGTLVELKPGENFLDWIMSIKPYYQPTEIMLISEPMLNSTGALLAAASFVEDWMRDNDLIRFLWFEKGMDPIIERLNRIAVNCYGLNGFTYDHIMAAVEVLAHQQSCEEEGQIIHLERDHPQVLYHLNLLDRYGGRDGLEALQGATTVPQIEEALQVLANVPVPINPETNIPSLVLPDSSGRLASSSGSSFSDVFRRGGNKRDKEVSAFTDLLENLEKTQAE